MINPTVELLCFDGPTINGIQDFAKFESQPTVAGRKFSEFR